jgi:hypothetical protein
VSWALFGLNGEYPFHTYVSGVIERAGLGFHSGSYGIQRGDAVGFLWGGSNNYDHIELALESPDSNGSFRTIGTNAAPSDAMAIRWRSTRYVVAYGRPAYLAPSGGGSTPINPALTIPEGYEDMAEPIYIKGDKKADIAAFYTNVSDANRPGPGAVYKGKRPIGFAEYQIVTALGFPHPKQNDLIIIPQSDFEAINSVGA